jgi:phosphoribosylaminoimidazolecarboxamide formyltransferase/IMP cyclohydrolase
MRPATLRSPERTMRALISVSDKSGVTELARALHERGVEIISTGGTAAAIGDTGIPVTSVVDVTGFPEMLDGRVKTLHPAIHGGLLARLENADHRRQIEEAGIAPISMLVVNLYPFERTVTAPGSTPDEIVENIDIGGPAMVRAGAKNFDHVAVVTDPGDYPRLLEMLDAPEPEQRAFRRALAAKAFAHVSTYDSLVSAWLRGDDPLFPEELSVGMRLASIPKYGENAHQRAAVYTRLRPGEAQAGILAAEQLKGDTLSFNNHLDADAAWNAAQLFDAPTVAIVKHTVPCGLATRDTLADAYRAAYEGDTVSAFGGIVALNRPVDRETAREMRKLKLDIILAPGYDDDALELLQKKKGTRILRVPNRSGERVPELDLRPIAGGLLVQEPDITDESAGDWSLVTDTAPTEAERRDLEFAWRVIPLIKSNAILFVKDQAIVGLGAGQPNRLESVAIAARKAGDNARGAVMASDAFFPFPDGIEQGIAAGITAVVQPGGSVNDQLVIDAANEAGIAMLFTGVRHFRH